jgi:hypothetical protein
MAMTPTQPAATPTERALDPRIAVIAAWFEEGDETGRLEYGELLSRLDSSARAARSACRYCGSINGETPPGHHVDPMTGDALRAQIAAVCPLNNPRLSEVDWDAVAAVFDSPDSGAARAEPGLRAVLREMEHRAGPSNANSQSREIWAAAVDLLLAALEAHGEPQLRAAITRYLAIDDAMPAKYDPDEDGPIEEWDRQQAEWTAARDALNALLAGEPQEGER